MRLEENKVIYDQEDFMAGFISKPYSSFQVQKGQGAAYMQNFDPFTTPDTVGTACPGAGVATITNVSGTVRPASPILDMIMNATGTFGYGIGGTSVHRFEEPSTLTNSAAAGFPHIMALSAAHINHATLAGKSVALYRSANGSRVFYGWSDNTDWDVGIYNPADKSFNDDFMSTVPATPLGTTATDLTGGASKNIVLYKDWGDDYLYIGAGNLLHAYDGSANKFYSQQLDLPKDYEIVSIVENGYDLVVFANTTTVGNAGTKKGKATAFFWGSDRPTTYYKVVDLDDNYVSAAFPFKGSMGCFTGQRGSSPTYALRLFNGNTFEPVAFYDFGGLPVNGGVDIIDDCIYWNANGQVSFYGQQKGKFPSALFQPMSGSGSNAGFLKALSGNTIYLSSGIGSTGGFEYESSLATASYFRSTTWYPTLPFGKQMRLKGVQVKFANTCTNQSALKLELMTNGASTTTIVFTGVDDVVSTDMIRRYSADSSGNPFPSFNDISIKLTWSGGGDDAPMVERVELFYALIDFNN